MATVVVDYAWGRPGVAALKAYGAVAVCRYLSWLPNGKVLSRAEADTLRAGGIDIVSNWEYYGNWANDYSGGYASGVKHATEAAKQHTACGGPPERPIYFSTDFQPTVDQLPTVADYYRGVASVIGLARTGAYGSWRSMAYLFNAGVIRWGWQTYAWSHYIDPDGVGYTRWEPRCQLRQVKNGITIGGVDCDRDEAQATDYGQWGGTDVALTEDDVTKIWWRDTDPDDKVTETAWVALHNARQDAKAARDGVAALSAKLDALAAKLDQLATGTGGTAPTDAVAAVKQALREGTG